MSHTLTSPRKSFAPLLLAGTLAFTTPAHAEQHGPGSLGWVRHWNHVAIDASGLDHTPLAPGENRVFGENLGPGRAARAMAIVHVAMFDAMNAIHGGYRSYTGMRHVHEPASIRAAIAQASHDA